MDNLTDHEKARVLDIVLGALEVVDAVDLSFIESAVKIVEESK